MYLHILYAYNSNYYKEKCVEVFGEREGRGEMLQFKKEKEKNEISFMKQLEGRQMS